MIHVYESHLRINDNDSIKCNNNTCVILIYMYHQPNLKIFPIQSFLQKCATMSVLLKECKVNGIGRDTLFFIKTSTCLDGMSVP